MAEFVDLSLDVPELEGRNPAIYVLNSEIETTIRSVLAGHGFEIYVVEGSTITNENNFFDEIARSLEFPDYFGKNWNAFNDCFGDFCRELNVERVALIWRDLQFLINSDLQTFVDIVPSLRDLVYSHPFVWEDRSKEAIQIEVFLLGTGVGFPTSQRG